MIARLLIALLVGATVGAGQTSVRQPIGSEEIDAIATLVMLEDTRQFDAAAIGRLIQSQHAEVRRRAAVAIGRIADKRGAALLEKARGDKDANVAAAVVFATGQLRDPAHVLWLSEMLSSPKVAAAREAAIALGKIQAPEARAALASYLSKVVDASATRPVIGEALLSMGRFRTRDDLTPIVRWKASPDVEVRWRAGWALFRPQNPEAFPHLLELSRDASAEVRFWAVRGLAPPPASGDPSPVYDAARASGRLREAVKDADRRVRTEALRALAQHDDDASFAVVLDALDASDSWLSVSAAEAMARFTSHAETIVPRLVAATAANRPLALRISALTSLAALAPDAAIDAAAALAREKGVVAQTAARQALGRTGDAGKQRLEKLIAEGVLPAPPARAPRTQAPVAARPAAEYRRIVERWIVPDDSGRPRPRAIWETSRGTIELELYPGDAPLGVEHFVRVTESGEIVGTEFGRVVPNFVAQQRAIRDDIVLRDEVNRHGLTRGNLSWASAGLDTGRPGYTLGITPQPHNEGSFTALGRVISGMDVVERLELGDRITAARMAPAETTTTQAARPRRTEAEARAAAERNRQQRQKQRKTTGKPVELIRDYVRASIGPVPPELLADPDYRIDGTFYKKYADAMGIPVLASAKVPDAAVLVARDIVNSMLAERPDIRRALIAKKWRTGVIAEVEMTMDIPEYSRMKRPGASRDEPVNQEDRDYHANRSRGLGGNPTTGAEENLLGYPATRYWGEHILVHEFAHAIMGGGIREVDPAMFAEIRAAYDEAMAAGKYVHGDGRKHYATTNAGEYWAEGVQWWFFSNYGECFAGSVKVESPEEFGAYDPKLFELIGRVFKTHHIPMDVFHGRRIRPVKCP